MHQSTKELLMKVELDTAKAVIEFLEKNLEQKRAVRDALQRELDRLTSSRKREEMTTVGSVAQ